MQILKPETLFIGHETRYFERISSTNDFLKTIVQQNSLSEGYMIVAGEQTGGKGQNGKEWLSKGGDNLLTSILLRPTFLNQSQLHFLVFTTALAVRATLQKFLPQNEVVIKWPNDILIANHKIGGILIENISEGNRVASIVGIGINVNQKSFDPFNFPATSMRNCHNGKSFNLAEVLKLLCGWIEKYYLTLRSPNGMQQIRKLYVSQMYRLNECVYLESGSPYVVRGVGENGKLQLDGEGNSVELMHNENNIDWN